MDTTKLNDRLGGKLRARKPTEGRIATMPNTTLAPVSGSEYVALTSDALGIISENLKNQPLSYQLFDVIKSPSGGITSFSVPGISGDNMEKELTGIKQRDRECRRCGGRCFQHKQDGAIICTGCMTLVAQGGTDDEEIALYRC